MISGSCTPFVDAIRQAQLLTDAQLAKLAGDKATDWSEPRELARELVRRSWLTPYQIERLARGHARELVLGKYVLLERLGEGGMGQVFKARHRIMDRIVALKIIRPDLLHHGSAVRRFHQEIRAVAQLSHPNIVIAHDADQDGDTHFLVMEYVEGIDLKQLVRTTGRLQISQACEYIRQAAEGLQHAHERGLVHRDLKPGNLLLTWNKRPAAPGESSDPAPTLSLDSPPVSGSHAQPIIKVLDLGLALLRSHDQSRNPSSDVTQSGALIGTPDYMAPEQAIDARHVDIRADVYSLGCTLYFLLTARAPFEDASFLEKLYRHKFELPPPLISLRPEAPPGLVGLMDKLLAKEPENRFQTPAQVAEALLPFSQGGDAVAIRLPAEGMVPRESKRGVSTLGTATHRPDTMSSPDADPALLPEREFVSLDRLMAELFPPAAGPAEQRPLPAISSVSEFVAWDSGLEQLATPPGVRKRRWWPAAVIVCAFALGGVVAAFRFGGGNRDDGSNRIPERPPGLKVETSASSFTPREQQKGQTPARGEEAGPVKPKEVEPGQPRPLRVAGGAEIAVAKEARNADHPPPGEDKPAGPMAVKSLHVPLKQPAEWAAFTANGRGVLAGSEEVLALHRDGDNGEERNAFTLIKYQYQVLLGSRPPLRAAWPAPRSKVWLATIDRPVIRGEVRPPGPVLGYHDPESQEPVRIFPCASPPITCVGGSPASDRMVVTGDAQGGVTVWDVGDKLRKRHGWQNHRNVVECLAVSADGHIALSGDRSGKLWLWDLGHGAPLRELTGQDGSAAALALSADGSRAACLGEDGAIRVWETGSGKEITPAALRKSAPCACLAFSADGKRLAIGRRDGMICLLDLATGAFSRSWNAHTGTILAVALDSETGFISSVGTDNSFHRWALQPAAGSCKAR
jgi:serine/threonine-protein kinase